MQAEAVWAWMAGMQRGEHGGRAVWVAVGWTVACVLVVGVLLVVRESRDGSHDPDAVRRTLTRPREAAGYTLLETEQARRFARTAERDLRAQAPDANVVVGTYARQDEQVVYVGFAFAANSDQGEALATSAADALRDYFDSAGIQDPRPYDPGPLGGALLCGTMDLGSGSGQLSCGWADAGGTLASLRFATGPLADGPSGDAAAVTVDFRAAAEPRT